jgi:hypothetical protein
MGQIGVINGHKGPCTVVDLKQGMLYNKGRR